MPNHILVANRGEIAIRVLRTATDLEIKTTAIYASDDADSLHTRHANHAVSLEDEGVPAYLNHAKIIAIAQDQGCDAIHPGYGFLSESPEFALACEDAGITFIGPSSKTLELFGDKAQARALAESADVPVLPGLSHPTSLAEAKTFFNDLGGAVMLKAIAGGGGRGMRPVLDVNELEDAFARATSEAEQAFGSGDLYIEELLPRARHIEVQIIGDGKGNVSHLWDRECSLQRQRQKLIEIAPAFDLPESLRQDMFDAATRLGLAANYRGAGTIEFLVSGDRFVFMEANARLQVEHTVTESVTGIDLVAQQFKIADGQSLNEMNLVQSQIPQPVGAAVQARVNLETMNPDGTSRPGGGLITAYEQPSGPGVRVDGYGYNGYTTSPFYDSLIAKLIIHGHDLNNAIRKTTRALSEFRIEGVRNNIEFLTSLLTKTSMDGNTIHTRYVEDNIDALLQSTDQPLRYVSPDLEIAKMGADVDPDDPLAVLNVARPKPKTAPVTQPTLQGPDGTTPAIAPMQGTVVEISVTPGDAVQEGQPVAVMEALKMEHAIPAPVSGIVREVTLAAGETIFEDTPIVFIEPQDVEGEYQKDEIVDYDEIRPDLEEILRFQKLTKDESRPEATAKRHDAGHRTARENIYDLCDEGSFVEYGPLVTCVAISKGFY